MARNFIESGDQIKLNAGETPFLSGVPVLVGKRLAVPLGDIAAYASGPAAVWGVWRLPKAAVALSQGEPMYFDSAAGKITNVALNNTPAGYAFESVLAASADVCTKINA